MKSERYRMNGLFALVLMALLLSLALPASAAPTERVLYDFNCNTGMCEPYGILIFDSSGNLYGTTGGTVFKLTPDLVPATRWMLSVLHSFTQKEGQGLVAGVVFDSQGNLYGTGVNGGAYDEGVVFELSPSTDGWSENTLYNFCPRGGMCRWRRTIRRSRCRYGWQSLRFDEGGRRQWRRRSRL
jgi:uncharacterized repeat protein (TIGR03803 family)